MSEDTPTPIQLSATDPDGDTLTLSVTFQPTHGTLAGMPPNVTYTPAAGFAGADSFAFTAADQERTSAAATVAITVEERYEWTQRGPRGGFISAVAFHPTRAGEVWLSGDDGSGYHLSTDGGATMTPLPGVPVDQSAYAFAFDTVNDIVYAPNHFGRGLLLSADRGASWVLSRSGLASTTEGRRIFDVVILPGTEEVYVASSGGLFRSTDHGQTFAEVVDADFGPTGERYFTRLAVSEDPSIRIAAGTRDHPDTESQSEGRVFESSDGVSWTQVAFGMPTVSGLAYTANALYIGVLGGALVRVQPGLTSILNLPAPGNDGPISSGYLTLVRAVSGASVSLDRLYIGTDHLPRGDNRTNYGFHRSDDGGATFQKKVTGLGGASAFSLTVNPVNPDHVVLGTINRGWFVTTDAGEHWTAGTGPVFAQDSIAIAADESAPQHLLISSTAGLHGTSRVLESFDAGVTWLPVSALDTEDIAALAIAPGGGTLLAGSFFTGIHRAVGGSAGPWQRTLPVDLPFSRVAFENNQDAWAVTNIVLPTCEASVANSNACGLYHSANGGTSWTLVLPMTIAGAPAYGGIFDCVPRPGFAGQAVAVGGEVFATADRFATDVHTLGLAAVAAGHLFTTATFSPAPAAELWVASWDPASGNPHLYRTTGFTPAGPVVWDEVLTPARSGWIHNLHFDAVTGDLYATCFAGDDTQEPDTTQGVMRSDDGGDTWEFLEQGLWPTRLVFRLVPDPAAPQAYYLGMWGGSVMHLAD